MREMNGYRMPMRGLPGRPPKVDSREVEEDEGDEFDLLAGDLLQAVKSGDQGALAEALRALKEI